MTWPTSVPILVFLGLSVLDLGRCIRDRQTDVRRASSLNAPTDGAGIITVASILTDSRKKGEICEQIYLLSPSALAIWNWLHLVKIVCFN